VDRRKSFFKTLEKIGTVELFAAWSLDDKNWTEVAEASAMRGFKARGKEMTDEALSELVARVGPNSRQLENEVEKVCLYVGDRRRVTLEDVAAVCTRNKTARAFALGDALGDRNLPELLRRLDEELWEVKLDSQRSEIGLLYGLISKVRACMLC
jgi:DNA polymerase-3 subunit delta